MLSAIWDNDVVADLASRALSGLEITILHLFAVSQIAGYALGGCWMHIGSAQSVVAFSILRREVDARYIAVDWIKEITPIILQLLVLLTLIIYAVCLLADWLG